MATSRRDLLVIGLVVGGTYGALRFGPAAYGNLTGAALAFQPMERPEGFRRLAGGSISSGSFDPFVGLDSEAREVLRVSVESVESRLCEVLFEGWGGTVAARGVVPIASFSDYNCPYCRIVTQRLAAYQAETGTVEVAWHELPLLGDASRDAAHAALAAKRQGAYVAFHERLMRSPFQPTDEYLRILARDLGIDADRLLMDMERPAVAREIAESEALARLFATVGTPVVVVGRTVVQGAIDLDMLERLVMLEREAGPVPGCR